MHGSDILEIIKGLLAQPDQAIDSIALLKESEQVQLLEQSSGETVSYPEFDNIAAYLEATKANHQDKSALRFDGEHLTYAQLHERAEQLAAFLQKESNLPAQAPIAL